MTQISNAVSLSTIRELLKRNMVEFRSKYLKLRDSIQIASSIAGITLAASASSIVVFRYDSRHTMAGPFLALLSLKYLIFHLSLNLSVLDARREFEIKATFNAVRTVALWATAFWFASQGWVHAVVIALAMNQLI